MEKYRRIQYEDRCQIHALAKVGKTQAEIGAALGFSQGSVSRELSRNRGRRGYRFKQAQGKAQTRQDKFRQKPRKFTARLRGRIARKMREERWSPEQISFWLKETCGVSLSHERIYRMVWDDKRAGGDLWRCLRRRGKKYNKRGAQQAGRGVIPGRIDISERPAVVDDKARLGDWEGDTIVGTKHKGALLTHVERKSLLTTISKLDRATAKAAHTATVRRLKPLRGNVHTITYDNGKEFAAHQKTAQILKASVFFATPYHAWERGVNENTNGLIPRPFPKV